MAPDAPACRNSFPEGSWYRIQRCPCRRLRSAFEMLWIGQEWGCGHCAHFGFGSGRISARSGRVAYVFGSSQGLQGLECSSSPTSGTCFSCSEACEPLSVHILFTCGPLQGPFSFLAGAGRVVASLVFTRFLLFGLFGRLFTSSWWVWGRHDLRPTRRESVSPDAFRLSVTARRVCNVALRCSP
jgi:hypothetical protein